MSIKPTEIATASPDIDTNPNKVLVSIVMPIYNRARFLEGAINSIMAQTHQHWELIIVDDGSSDNSIEILSTLTQAIAEKVSVLSQANQGPAAARNKGIKQAKGALLAFFDSDDLWLEHHLSDCIAAFERHPELSWVYAACERVQYDTGELILESTFYTDGKPNKLFDIAKPEPGGVHILDTEQAILLQLTAGLDNGLQNSVLKRKVTDEHLLPNFRVGEDRLFIIMALKSGFKMGFIDAIHVRYHVHDENISDTNKHEENYEKRIQALEQLIAAKKTLINLVLLNAQELKVYEEQLAKEMFWELGYALYQSSGNYKKAISTYIQAIKVSPYHLKFYRTLMLSIIKYIATIFTGRN